MQIFSRLYCLLFGILQYNYNCYERSDWSQEINGRYDFVNYDCRNLYFVKIIKLNSNKITSKLSNINSQMTVNKYKSQNRIIITSLTRDVEQFSVAITEMLRINKTLRLRAVW